MSGKEQICVGTNKAPFSWLPNYLVNDDSVSADALAVSLYLNGKPENWRCRPFDIKKRFKWGDHTWRKVSKELKALGLLHEKITQEGTMLWFEISCDSAPVDSRPSRTSASRKSTPLDNKDHNLDRSYKDHKDHMSNDFKKEQSKVTKAPMKQRIEALSADQLCLYEKLSKFEGLYKAIILSILETKTTGEIHNVLEMAIRENVKNPGKYLVKSLYKKSCS